MTKTERRRRQRVRRCAEATSGTSPDVQVPTDQQWKHYDRVLAGLVDLDIDDTFVDLDDLCPTSLRVVLHLNAIHESTLQARRNTAVKALQAACELCVFAAALHQTRHNLDFWTRFFASDVICRSFPPGHPIISTTARYIQAHGVSLVVDLSGTRLHHPILKHIETILTAPQSNFAHITGNTCTTAPVLGLRFADCHLTTIDLEGIGRLIASRGGASNAFDPTTLCLVDLSRNTVGTRGWEALATYLSSSSARCIMELKLDGVLTAGSNVETSSLVYQEAFGRTVAAVMTTSNDEDSSKSVALSFADTENIDPALVRTLRQVLELATRPIAALSFAGCSMENFSGWLQLGRLLFTPFRTCGDDCRLDLSRPSDFEDMVDGIRVSLAEKVAEAIPRMVYEGIWMRVPVRCRLLSTSAVTFTETGESVEVDVDLATSEWYTIIRHFENAFEIQIMNAQGVVTTGLVPTSDVIELMIGESSIVRFGFTSILFDGYDNSWDHLVRWRSIFVCEPLKQLFMRVGQNITRFSMRHIGFPRDLSSALQYCPRLHTINFHGSSLYLCTVRTCFGGDIGSNLQSLNLSSARLRDSDLDEWPCLKLRHLVLVNNLLTSNALISLCAMLKETPTLLHVVIDGKCRSTDEDDKEAYAKARLEIDRCVRDEWIMPRAKLAFLSVLNVRSQNTETTNEMLDNSIIGSIFNFAGNATSRRVHWTI